LIFFFFPFLYALLPWIFPLHPCTLYGEEAGTILFGVESPSILRGSKAVPPTPFTPLEYGDLINTRTQDRLKLRFGEGFFLVVSGNTELLLKKEALPFFILNYGALEWIGGEESTPYRIRTQYGEVIPGKNAHLFLFQETERLLLYNFYGSCELASEEKRYTVQQGQKIERKTEGFSEPQPISYTEAQEVEQRFLIFPDLFSSKSFWVQRFFPERIKENYKLFRFRHGPLTPPWQSQAEVLITLPPQSTPRGVQPAPSSSIRIQFRIEEDSP
jgi:hypothetical protein